MVKDNSKLLADLARNDINIFSAHVEQGSLVVEYEYGWHPDAYKTKWTKAVFLATPETMPLNDVYEHILREVKNIRSELE